MPVVWIPALLRTFTGGQSRLTVPGETVGEVVAHLDAAYPGIRARLCEGSGGDDLSPHLAVFVDGQIGRLRMLQPVSEHSEVHFVPAIEGGA